MLSPKRRRKRRGSGSIERSQDAVAKVDEELGETKEAIAGKPAAIADELGDLLFAVEPGAKNQLDAETVLAASTKKFITRFHAMERELKNREANWASRSRGAG
jgi:uncharacterized protein YabN with tetrapyrrole methylase and pyrophosphatase domain